jgi:hypothetical protein
MANPGKFYTFIIRSIMEPRGGRPGARAGARGFWCMRGRNLVAHGAVDLHHKKCKDGTAA